MHIKCCVRACASMIGIRNRLVGTEISITMGFGLDGNSETGTHVRRSICYLTYLRHLIRSRAGSTRIYFLRKALFSFMRAQHVLSYHLI